MVITNFGKERAAVRLGSNVSFPTHFAIGIGSTTAAGSNIALGSEVDRQIFTSFDATTAQKIAYQGDWNSNEMSGIQLAEIGIVTSGATEVGSIWSRTAFTPLTFDGTNELQIEETWEVY